MLVEEMLELLRERVLRRVRNGTCTERGFAQRLGLSQSHLHNVLKGNRTMTPVVADQILRALEMTVEDLLEPAAGRKGPGSHPDSGSGRMLA